jgi:mono/diheme cytochrome c family protein
VKRTAVAVALLLLLWGSEAALVQPAFADPQDPLAGSRILGAKGCVKCHAVAGVGGQGAPDLGRVPRPRSFPEFASAMWNHLLPDMAERIRRLGITRAHLNPREAGDLIGFLWSVNYFDRIGNVEIGRRLFSEKKCVACHQVGGSGGVVGPNLDHLTHHGSWIFVASAMWNHGPAMAQAMRARGIQRPTFTESELLDLVAFLKSASPLPSEGPAHVLPGSAEEGQKLFVEKSCVECHGPGGRGGPLGPVLAERRVPRSFTRFAAVLWNKEPAMIEAMRRRGISLPHLRADEMADLVAHLDALRYFALPGDARNGWSVLADKGCLNCHSVSVRDRQTPRNIAWVTGLDSQAVVLSALWNHLLVSEQVGGHKEAWPRFRSDEMADLLALLRSLQTAPRGFDR